MAYETRSQVRAGWLRVALAASATLALSCRAEHHGPFFQESSDTTRDAAGASDSRPDLDAQEEPIARVGCEGGPELHVLFIGNSHTHENDLPALVRELACAAGTKVVSQQVTPGGASLIDQSASPDVLTAIKADAWDLVVLQDQQQHPSHRLESIDAKDVPAVKTLVDAIVAHDKSTRRLFYMVYGRKDGDPPNCDYYPLLCTFEGETRAIEQGYRLYAERTGGEVAPVALAWQAVNSDSKSPLAPAALWNGDGYHPALAGSYLAAATIAGVMLDEPTAALAYDGGLAADVATYLRAEADRAVKAEKSDPRVDTLERVQLACDAANGASDAADASAVVITLSHDSCAELRAGTASVSGKIDTTASCRNGFCRTVPLGDWHHVSGGVVQDGSYQTHLQVDLNANGKLDTGDLEACTTGAFKVGSGQGLTIDALSVR